jgi:hypothetical protein
LTVQETEPFARSAAGLAGIPEDVVGDFVQQSFLLYDTPDEYYSNPLSGQDEVFVVALRSVIPPEVPAFEDVREAATEAAEADALAEALAEKANRVRTVLEQTFLDDADIHETLDALGIESSETGYFSVVDGLEEVSYAGPLRRVVGSLNVGETSEPIPDGPDLVLAHVMDRKPAAEEGFLPFKDSFDRTMQLRYASALLSDWQNHLLEEAGFVDRTAPEPEDPAAEE